MAKFKIPTGNTKLKNIRSPSRLPDGRHNPEYKRWYRAWKKYMGGEKEREEARIKSFKRESPEQYPDRIMREVIFLENKQNQYY